MWRVVQRCCADSFVKLAATHLDGVAQRRGRVVLCAEDDSRGVQQAYALVQHHLLHAARHAGRVADLCLLLLALLLEQGALFEQGGLKGTLVIQLRPDGCAPWIGSKAYKAPGRRVQHLTRTCATRERLRLLMSDDLPTLGRPTTPTVMLVLMPLGV